NTHKQKKLHTHRQKSCTHTTRYMHTHRYTQIQTHKLLLTHQHTHEIYTHTHTHTQGHIAHISPRSGCFSLWRGVLGKSQFNPSSPLLKTLQLPPAPHPFGVTPP